MVGKRIGIALDLHCRMGNPVSRKDNYFEACMKKFEFLLKNCDILLQAGDVFTKSREEDICKNRMLSLLNRYGIPMCIVPGNHDIENDVLDSLVKTSLGNLASNPNVTILSSDKIWNIAGIKVGVLAYDIKEAKVQTFSEPVDIVIGHHFYNWERDLNLSLTDEDILRYNAKYVFLGHDHEPHKTVQVGNTKIYRYGSVMRENLMAYTQNHHPCFAEIIVDSNGNMSEPELIEIPHAPFEDVFRWEEKKIFKKCTKLISDIKDFLGSMDIKSEDQRTISSILINDLKAPEDVVNYLQLVYRINHIQF